MDLKIKKEQIKDLLKENFEIVHTKDGGGNSSCVAVVGSEEEFICDDSDISIHAEYLANKIIQILNKH